MQSLNEILKSSGLSGATAKEGIATAAPETELEQSASEEVCERCAGAGFVRRTVRLGHPDFGKAFACECTLDEREDQRQARLERYSNLGSLSRLTFANLSPRGRSPNPQHQELFSKAVVSAQRFADSPHGWIVLTGPSGCGKTHLGAAIAGRCIEAGQAALFMVVPDLLDHLRAAYQPGSALGYDDLFDTLKSAQVLILDDLGVQSSTPWAEEKLFQLINHRYSNQLATVFTTNRSLSEFDARTQSRLSDAALSQVFSLEGGSAATASLLDALDLPRLRGMTFKNFDSSRARSPEESRIVHNVYKEAMDFAQKPQNWFTIAGHSGRGKTHLAAAIGNYCREAGMSVMFVVVPDLLDWLRSSYDPQNARTFDMTFDQVRGMPLLILDDLGAQSGTAWADEKLFQLLNYRYNACLPTVITTNARAQELEGRIRTRITDLGASNLFLMGEFDFWGSERAERAASAAPRPRGRPPRRS